MRSGDLYELLGVASSATSVEIRSAFRVIAMGLHPDRTHGDRVAEDAFKEASRAYAVLSDPALRQRYDRSSRGVGGRVSAPASPVFGGGRQSSWESSDWVAQREVWQNNVCPDCRGSGQLAATLQDVCIFCKGWGAVVIHTPYPEWRACALCSGMGRVDTVTCARCWGMGSARTMQIQTYRTPPRLR
jgi:molecular chaperone DnaJ